MNMQYSVLYITFKINSRWPGGDHFSPIILQDSLWDTQWRFMIWVTWAVTKGGVLGIYPTSPPGYLTEHAVKCESVRYICKVLTMATRDKRHP